MQINNINNYDVVSNYGTTPVANTKENIEIPKTIQEIGNASDDAAAVYEHRITDSSTQTIYNSDGVLLSASSGEAVNRIFQNNLKILGFYNPSATTDGNLGSAESQRAIRNFQRVFGLQVNGGSNNETRAKLTEVMDFYNSINSSDLASVASLSSGNADYNVVSESANVRKTWTFLRMGMGLDQTQAAGVMGNLLRESGLSPTNAQNSYMGTSNLRDTNYEFSTTDGVGYGLMQWTNSGRKQGLEDMATTMGSSVSDMNVQFAYMKLELERDYTSQLNQIKSSNSISEVTEIFAVEIERPSNPELSTRISLANSTYNALQNY